MCSTKDAFCRGCSERVPVSATPCRTCERFSDCVPTTVRLLRDVSRRTGQVNGSAVPFVVDAESGAARNGRMWSHTTSTRSQFSAGFPAFVSGGNQRFRDFRPLRAKMVSRAYNDDTVNPVFIFQPFRKHQCGMLFYLPTGVAVTV